ERTVWSPFSKDSKYFEPSKRELMINFAVDDLEGLLASLKSKGVTILGHDDSSDPTGKFAWILDPDGTKIELWQAKEARRERPFSPLTGSVRFIPGPMLWPHVCFLAWQTSSTALPRRDRI